MHSHGRLETLQWLFLPELTLVPLTGHLLLVWSGWKEASMRGCKSGKAVKRAARGLGPGAHLCWEETQPEKAVIRILRGGRWSSAPIAGAKYWGAYCAHAFKCNNPSWKIIFSSPFWFNTVRPFRGRLCFDPSEGARRPELRCQQSSGRLVGDAKWNWSVRYLRDLFHMIVPDTVRLQAYWRWHFVHEMKTSSWDIMELSNE